MSIFNTIDSEAKAYALGILTTALDEPITVKSDMQHTLKILSTELDLEHPLLITSTGCVRVPLGAEAREDINKQFGAEKGDLTIKKAPDIPDDLRKHYVRGLFDTVGEIISYFDPMIAIDVPDPIVEAIVSWSKTAQKSKHGSSAIWDKTDAIDILGDLYEDSRFYSQMGLKTVKTILQGKESDPIIKWAKIDSRGVAPKKDKVSDSGYDLTLIDKIKETGDVTFYTTGISIEPPFGWYFDLLPRSSVAKTGYMLANSVGIIDRSYRGEIIAALRKVDSEAEDIQLPCKFVQIIPRRIVHFELQECSILSQTGRGSGGFGSTD